MARTSKALSSEEVIIVGELASVPNNTVIYKDNTGAVTGVALGASGTVLTSAGTNSAPTFDVPAGGFSWNTSVNGASGTGLTLAMDNSYAAGGVGQSITMGNTQTNALVGYSVNTGTSSRNHVGLSIDSTFTSVNRYGISAFNYDSATQAPASTVYGMQFGVNFNTSSANSYISASYIVQNNAGAGSNTGIVVQNLSNDAYSPGSLTKAGHIVYQGGTDGTAIAVYAGSNVNSSTNGLVNLTVDNTQSGASKAYKTDLGSSAQAHDAYYATGSNASATANAFNADMATGWTGNLFRGAVNSVDKFKVDKDGKVTGDTYNKVAITAPAAGATLTIADGATLTASASATVSGTNTGDQNTFTSVEVSGQTTVTAASTTQALTLVAGTNVTITTDNTAKSVTINASGGGGLSWGTSVNGATGTGLALAMDNSYAASGIGQSITIGNTQTNALVGLVIDTGTSNVSHVGASISAIGGSGVGLRINSFGSATQMVAANALTSLAIGANFNTNLSGGNCKHIFITNENNANAGANSWNTGISIRNASTKYATDGLTQGMGSAIAVYQSGAGGTAIHITGGNNINTSTNGLVNYVLGNTQSGATVMQKIDTGTSAQGHTGLLVNMFNNSSLARGTKYDLSSTGDGHAIEITGTGSNTRGGILFSLGSSKTTGNGFTFMKVDGTNNFISATLNQTLLDLSVNQRGNAAITRSNPITNVNFTASLDAANTSSISYNGSQFWRTSQTLTSGSANLTVAGNVVDILCQTIQSAGTLADTSNLLNLSATGVLWNGKFINQSNTISGAIVARSTDLVSFSYSRTNTATSGTIADNFNSCSITRTSVQNGGGGTLTATGSVLKLENVATQTAGTLTDTVAVLSLVQDNDSTGGHILFNTYTGVPLVDGTLYFDGTNFKYRAGGATKTITAA